MSSLWKPRVPSAAFLDGDVTFEILEGRELSLSYSYESAAGGVHAETLIFEGVEAFKCTYFNARDPHSSEAYESLIDCGKTEWLGQLTRNLERRGSIAEKLAHLMIDFDDGPCYEVVCRGFRAEHIERPIPNLAGS